MTGVAAALGRTDALPSDPATTSTRRLTILRLVGCGCLGLHALMRTGHVPNPTLRFASTSSLLCFLCIPMATLALLGYRPLAYLTAGRWRPIVPAFLLGLVCLLVCAYVLGRSAVFGTVYGNTLTLEFATATLVGMLCLEYFFRGYLLLPNFAPLGWWAALVAALPYALVHIGKPLPEIVGSIPFALWLSYFAVRSGSIWYGVALHWTIAVAINYWASLPR